jgi:hypothetical protein
VPRATAAPMTSRSGLLGQAVFEVGCCAQLPTQAHHSPKCEQSSVIAQNPGSESRALRNREHGLWASGLGWLRGGWQTPPFSLQPMPDRASPARQLKIAPGWLHAVQYSYASDCALSGACHQRLQLLLRETHHNKRQGKGGTISIVQQCLSYFWL